MRHIRKRPPPEAFIRWTAENQGLPSLSYPGLPTALKDEVQRSLLREQGGLCCYTGRSIDEGSSHIEHLKPQKLCEYGEDVAYHNLLAAFPADGGDRSHGYGAPIKGGDFDPQRFISPLEPGCEQRFRFDLFGRISAAEGDLPARDTIQCLGLDAAKLEDLRRAKIQELIANPDFDPSEAQLERLIRDIGQPGKDGRLRAFCFAVKQALIVYLERKRRKAKQRAFARKASER